MHPSDKELVQKVLQKDKQAFVVLFDRYKDKVLGYLCGYLGDYHKAYDVTLKTFMTVYDNLHTYKGLSKLSTWIYGIATNLAKKELRKEKGHKEVSLESPINKESVITLGDLIADDKYRPDYRVRVQDLEEFIYKLLSELDEKYKEVLLLCDVKGLSYIEAARILKCNPVTVGTRARRGRKRFYKLLKKYRSEL